MFDAVKLEAEAMQLLKLVEDRRDQMQEAINYLSVNGYFEAPASAANHNNCVGGLAAHSLGVTKLLLLIKRGIMATPEVPMVGDLTVFDVDQHSKIVPITDESCVIVGLLHDLHKCTDGCGRPGYLPNVLTSGKVSTAKPYVSNSDSMKLLGGYRSGILAARLIPLQEHELQAICCHDGQYTPENRSIAHEEHPLTLMLHFADMWCASQVEKESSWLYRPVSRLL
jgi:hypothetical protein